MRTIRVIVQILTAAPFIILVMLLSACMRGQVFDELFLVSDIVEPPTVRVGLTQGTSPEVYVSEAVFSVDGPVQVRSMDRATLIFEGDYLSYAKATVPGGLVRIDHRNAVWDSHLRDVRVIPLRNGTLRVGRRSYPGSLVIHANDTGKVALINHVDMENYVTGVVGMEMNPSVADQSLRAQLIAARTYALFSIKERARIEPEAPFDVYDDTRSQVYGGMERVDDHIVQLVRHTRGTVLTYDHKLFKAYYASTCGGHTEPARDMLGEGAVIPPLGGVRCSYCQDSKYYSWTALWPRKEIASRLKELRKDLSFSTVVAVDISAKASGGHAIQVTLTLDPGQQKVVLNANSDFRRMLNQGSPLERNLRSTLFEARVDGDSIRFSGHGWGHAVGLCQWGAYKLGDLGYTASAILRFYYPQAEIVQLY